MGGHRDGRAPYYCEPGLVPATCRAARGHINSTGLRTASPPQGDAGGAAGATAPASSVFGPSLSLQDLQTVVKEQLRMAAQISALVPAATAARSTDAPPASDAMEPAVALLQTPRCVTFRDPPTTPPPPSPPLKPSFSFAAPSRPSPLPLRDLEPAAMPEPEGGWLEFELGADADAKPERDDLARPRLRRLSSGALEDFERMKPPPPGSFFSLNGGVPPLKRGASLLRDEPPAKRERRPSSPLLLAEYAPPSFEGGFIAEIWA